MGLLLDEKHAAFDDFPTNGYTDWQWWDLCIKAKSIVIDSLNVAPIVRVIDNFVTNHKLANVFEAKVGKGKLVFSSIDLHNELEKRPVAHQLKASLLRYMESEAFSPSETVEMEDLDFSDAKENKQYKDSDIYYDKIFRYPENTFNFTCWTDTIENNKRISSYKQTGFVKKQIAVGIQFGEYAICQ